MTTEQQLMVVLERLERAEANIRDLDLYLRVLRQRFDRLEEITPRDELLEWRR